MGGLGYRRHVSQSSRDWTCTVLIFSVCADAAKSMNAKYAGMQTKHKSFQPLPQPRSLAAALLEMQLTLLGSLLAVVSQANQLQVHPSPLKASWGNPWYQSEPHARVAS